LGIQQSSLDPDKRVVIANLLEPATDEAATKSLPQWAVSGSRSAQDGNSSGTNGHLLSLAEGSGRSNKTIDTTTSLRASSMVSPGVSVDGIASADVANAYQKVQKQIVQMEKLVWWLYVPCVCICACAQFTQYVIVFVYACL
jgi:hypothetical protein